MCGRYALHAHPDVVARYQRLGSALYRTDDGGAIGIELQQGQPPAVSRYRDRHLRYWHAPREGVVLDEQLLGKH